MINNMDEDKIFYKPGDIVTIKQGIPDRPIMVVVKKETLTFRNKDKKEKEDYFIGIRCRWFTTRREIQEAVFNTKDLIRC